jgi:RHS repeat-associated protein
MTQIVASGTTSNYAYRADGLRTQKEIHTGSTVSDITQYRYNGQMGVEDVELHSTNGGTSYTVTAMTRSALGARGIDAVSRTTNSGTSVSYPLYDGHGNNFGMLSKSGYSWSITDERTYDAWGNVRVGGLSDDQKGRYCGNLGHKQDDESGLIYMRARYYESQSGRFVSEDCKRNGSNWTVYSKNDPVNRLDGTGNEDEYELFGQYLFGLGVGMMHIGCAQFAIGLFSFMNGIARLEASYVGIGIGVASGNLGLLAVALVAAIATAYMIVAGISNLTGGANMVVRGSYTAYAGKLLMALGEDAMEYVGPLLAAAGATSPNIINSVSPSLGNPGGDFP